MEGKLTRFLKYGKINKYLKSKDKSQYNCLDNIFDYYVDGNMQKLLEDNEFTRINIYPKIGRKGKYLQIECWFYNLIIDVGFADDCFDYVAYLTGISAEEFGNSVTIKNYSDDFSVENFFENFHNILGKDNRLKI